MKYYELLAKANLANQIPLYYGEAKLSADTAAEVVLLKVRFNSIKSKMQEILKEAIEKLKKEGFDERANSIDFMYRIDSTLKAIEEWEEGKLDDDGKPIKKPKSPSEEDIAKANEYRKLEKEYLEEVKELNEVYDKAANKQLFEDIEFSYGLSRQAWKDIYNMLGTEGKINFTYTNGKSKEIHINDFIQYLGELIVE